MSLTQKFITWQPPCQNNNPKLLVLLSQPRLAVAGSWMAEAQVIHLL